jgi:hypothetical protein
VLYTFFAISETNQLYKLPQPKQQAGQMQHERLDQCANHRGLGAYKQDLGQKQK